MANQNNNKTKVVTGVNTRFSLFSALNPYPSTEVRRNTVYPHLSLVRQGNHQGN